MGIDKAKELAMEIRIYGGPHPEKWNGSGRGGKGNRRLELTCLGVAPLKL
ncbi:MAG: hypothetical protein NVS1B11_12030 [Terriglobales bacterium]